MPTSTRPASTSRARSQEAVFAEHPLRRQVLEAIMAGVIVAGTLFLCGIVVGIYAVMAVAIRREDRRNTLPIAAPDRISSSTRRLNGLACRDLDQEFLRPAGELVH